MTDAELWDVLDERGLSTGETSHDAAARELHEETGLEVVGADL
ncbi:hypothetical protein GCM10009809_25570 [Isoptericola hypogeus]|uniref:NUDIX domain-containing protein n=1 Tax=Isoptericola hypogeus TaxID=300179 RepID=A0ABN2JIX9_9MICO